MNDNSSQLASALADEVLAELERRRRPRGATYRFQFNSKFTFRDATRLVPYLKSLGITHVYASPYFTAQPGSVHGYDVCSHEQLNPEIGTPDDYEAFVAALREHGLAQVLDMVPNHMAASSCNPWWMDVLENGPSSPYAHYFDIDWRPVKDELADKVLLPILGDQYGKALEAAQLQIDMVEGAFVLRYYYNTLPIGPKSSIPILQHRLDELRTLLGESSDAFLEYQSIITALQHLPPSIATSPEQMEERQREKEVIKRRLRRLQSETPAIAEHVRRNVEEFNGKPGDPRSFDRLDELLQTQCYRLCHWRAASDEVNYRRFFDVNGLAAICVEAPDVFERVHRLVMQLLARGDLDGLRIDHIDGLLDPTRYLWRLQWAYLAELAWRAYARRAAVAINDALGTPPTLAIVREETPVPAASDAHEPHMPPPDVAGQIAGAMMEQAGAEHAAPDRENSSTTTLATWSELRPVVLRELCDRLGLPYPDRELLALGHSPAMQSAEEIAASPAQDVVYKDFRLGDSQLPLYVVVEKILGPDEPLPDNWPVAGTSGYDFLQLLNGLLVDPGGFREMVRNYERFVGEQVLFSEVMYRSKLLILRFSMSSELQMLAHRINRISEQHRRSRDFTLNMLRLALRETLANFPVYRTYAGPAGVSERDRKFVSMAIARAKRRNPAVESAIFDFLKRILLLELPEGTSQDDQKACELFAGRFQQVTSPVMAKGVEDTAFYSYCPLASVNEVGSHPDVAPVSIADFHKENASRLEKYPLTMLGTSTHDTKRSEDVRARINILAEIAPQWRKICNNWLRQNKRHHREVDGREAPGRNDEYLLYQTLVGFWPTHRPSDEEHRQLIERLQAYMEKATHESKERTSWVNPNAEYDQTVRDFVANILERKKTNRFLPDFEKFHESIVDLGLYTALSQAALKIMSPGVPDVYQGQELWDFSLVDPDNRRAVDYEQRQSLLTALQAAVQAGAERQTELAREFAANPRDPRLKLYATWRLLNLRRDYPDLFTGDYVPLQVTGTAAKHVVAFCWQREAGGAMQQVVVVAPRLLGQLAFGGGESRAINSPETWGDTRVEFVIPEGRRVVRLFTGKEVPPGSSLNVGELLVEFPIAVLTSL
jgi:(1->4)-alpha-D-glucan 1-alpha-D-glucosylmutase